MKEVDGCHWVARPQPLPALEVKRPEVHESVDGEDAMDAMDATELCEEEKEIGNPLRFCFQMYQEVAFFILFLRVGGAVGLAPPRVVAVGQNLDRYLC